MNFWAAFIEKINLIFRERIEEIGEYRKFLI